jgi:CDGSH-type Zn-finger protein
MPDVTITPTQNGPYLVTGTVIIEAPDGRVINHPSPVALCRCGHSSNKPFCDGTHATINFDGTLAKSPMGRASRLVAAGILRSKLE